MLGSSAFVSPLPKSTAKTPELGVILIASGILVVPDAVYSTISGENTVSTA